MGVSGTSAKRLEVTVRGDVQGVNFRNEADAAARRLGLTGGVWNTSDGGVRIVAEGPEDGLRELLDWAQHGPDRARVDACEHHWSPPTGEFGDFSVQR